MYKRDKNILKAGILVVSSKYPPEYSGSGLRAHNTYKRLRKKHNIRFRVLCSSIENNTCMEYSYEDVKVTRIAKKLSELKKDRSNNQFKYFFKKLFNRFITFSNYTVEAILTFLYLFRNRKSIDLIHIFGNVYITSAAILYSKVFKVPVILELVNLVNDPHQYQPKLLDLFFSKRFPQKMKIICISQYLKDICISHGYNENQLICRGNPVDNQKFYYSPVIDYAFRAKQYGFNKNDIVILHMAKFIPRKQQSFILRVLKRLPDKYKLVLAGPIVNKGPLKARDLLYFNSLKEYINKNCLQKKVKVINSFVKTPELYIKAADIFVLPSEKEGLGTPVLEALACGRPVLTNEIPGVFDKWVKNGINGYCCKLNEDLWCDRLKKISRIPKESLAESSRGVILKASTSVIDDEYIELIKATL
jgi:glycosyltransferase involved in cell wall biosynthesis